MAQQVKNLPSIHEVVGSIPGLAQRVKDLVLPFAVVQVTKVELCGIAVAVVQASSCSSDSTP